MRFLWLVSCLLLVIGMPQRVYACAAVPNPYYTIESITPSDGTSDIPRDTVIALQLKIWAGDAVGMSTVDVRVTAVASGEAISGALDAENSLADTRYWKPSTLLQPNTQYRVEVTIESTNPPANVQGANKRTASFTTAANASAPLKLDGSLHATLRSGTLPVLDCGICGPCQQTGERRAVVADVEAPRVSGGLESLGYQAWLTLTDRAAPTFDGAGEGQLDGEHSLSLSQFVHPQPGAANELMFEIPREDPNTDVCFGWNAWDAAGQWQSAAPLCIKATDVDAAFAQLAASAAAGATAPEPPAAGASSSSSNGDEAGGTAASAPRPSNDAGAAEPRGVHVKACAVAAVGGSVGSASSSALLAAAALWLRQRRRRKTWHRASTAS